jgi:hypothetical protein
LAIQQDIQASVFFLGIAALFLGRLPGGLIGVVRRIPPAVTRAARNEFDRVRGEKGEPVTEPAPMQPTAFAKKVLAENNGRTAAQPKQRVP